VANEIELQIIIERRVDRIGEAGEQQRIAVGGRTHDRLGGDISAGAWPVLDDDLLTKPVRQPASDQASHNVGASARRKAHDDVYGARRIGLRPRDPRYGRQRGSTGCQMQKISAGKFHIEPPLHHSITSSAMASSRSGTVSPSALAVSSSNLVGC